jgi:hypothetical protein
MMVHSLSYFSDYVTETHHPDMPKGPGHPQSFLSLSTMPPSEEREGKTQNKAPRGTCLSPTN